MSDSKDPETALMDALATLQLARDRYDEAKAAADIARRAETEAMNRLNAAQDAFDTATDLVRKDAPFASGWNRVNGRRA